MNPKEKAYNAAISKGQAMLPETTALLRLWKPGMSSGDLLRAAQSEGVLGRATGQRARDIVVRVFAPRYLNGTERPARWLGRLIELGVPPTKLEKIFLLYTARANEILHDFITEVVWAKYAAGSNRVTRDDALRFINTAADVGYIRKRWSAGTTVRIARQLMGTLEDFRLVGPDHRRVREIQPFRIDGLTSVYLAHELHFTGHTDGGIAAHRDWRLFGLEPGETIRELKRVQNRGRFILQFSGDLLRISWGHKSMEECLDDIARQEF